MRKPVPSPTDDILESDRLDGAPHPRHTEHLFGHSAAEADFLQAIAQNRLHHAWLITGPKGVGKATLAWRIARFLLATPIHNDAALFAEAAPAPPDTLDVPVDHPVARRIAALSQQGIVVLRRPWDDKLKRLKTEITVDETRKLKEFFAKTIPDGGRRVVIVDCADEMNPSAANAVLKVLEEPPRNTVFLLVSHQPSGLLPTIKSRCRPLRCAPLGGDDMARALAPLALEMPQNMDALATLAAGSVGAAVSLLQQGGPDVYAKIVALFSTTPHLDRTVAIQFAEWAGARGAADRLPLVTGLLALFLSRLARFGVLGPVGLAAAADETAVMSRLCTGPVAARRWADLHQTLGAELQHGLAVNLDPATMILDTVLKINATAEALVQR
jgi:DNA polymerase-3 subunit delta'